MTQQDNQREQDRQMDDFHEWNQDMSGNQNQEICKYRLQGWQAALSHAAQAKWQPIETAPKDCNVLLYYPLRGAIRGTWIDEEYAKNPKPYWRHDHAYIFGTGEARTNQPTHWMPLPGAPKKTAK